MYTDLTLISSSGLNSQWRGFSEHRGTQTKSHCSWPSTKPEAETARISAWFIHQAAPARVLLTPGALLSVDSLWAISGMCPKVSSVIQRFSYNRKPSHVRRPCQKLISERFPESCRASGTGIDFGQNNRGRSGRIFSPRNLSHHSYCTSEGCR